MKNINKNNKLLWITLGVILVIILIIILIRGHMTNLEKDILKKDSTRIMLYMDNIENSKSEEKDELDSYILYALEYGYNEYDKEKLTAKEIKKIIESNFTKKVSEEKINRIGITPLLMEKNIVHDPESKTYEIPRENITQRQIADTPITYYNEIKVKKSGKKYIIKYQEVTIKNPYDILNYYSDLNNENTKKNKKEENIKTYDTSKIMNYLTTKGKIKDVKLKINDGVIKKYGKVEKKPVKVIYKLKNTNFIVDKIKGNQK